MAENNGDIVVFTDSCDCRPTAYLKQIFHNLVPSQKTILDYNPIKKHCDRCSFCSNFNIFPFCQA